MNISPEQFGIEMSRLLKERKLTQRGLAEYLGVTSPTISYLLHNKLRPSAKHFDGIMEYIKADAAMIINMKELWRATQKNSEERNNINENLFALRCERGYTVQKVSADTGISADRLRILENNPAAIPTCQELELLKGFYGADSFGFGRSNYNDPNRNIIAEGGADSRVFLSGKVLPVIPVETLGRVPENRRLTDFLTNMTYKEQFCELAFDLAPRAAALLVCDAEEIHYGIPGTLEIIIGDNSRDQKDVLFIGHGARGAVTIFRKQRNRFVYSGFATPAPKISCIAALPILELKFTSSPDFNFG